MVPDAVPSGRRLRTYELLTPAGAYVPSAMPGSADLTIKMKKVNPDVGVAELEMAGQVRSSSLLLAVAGLRAIQRPGSQTMMCAGVLLWCQQRVRCWCWLSRSVQPGPCKIAPADVAQPDTYAVVCIISRLWAKVATRGLHS